MPVDSKHPQYTAYYDDWVVMRDTYAGERVVKAAGESYLPATSGMVADGMSTNQKGRKAYDAYKTRAVFPDYVADAVKALNGVLHRKPAEVKLPKAMEFMLQRASNQGESLQMLLERITEQQLVYGRLGLLGDLPDELTQGAPQPYISLYNALSIINWNRGRKDDRSVQKLGLVVLDETEPEQTAELEWLTIEKYRVLQMLDGKYSFAVARRDAGSGTVAVPTDYLTPMVRGQTLDFIPFTIVNANDVVVEPSDPPLMGLARLSLTIYRGEADYRQTLFMQGQDTLVLIGYSKPENGEELRVGANARIELPLEGDAKYIGVGHEGLAEQRSALEADRRMAGEKGAHMLDSQSKQKESGEALTVRVAARTATLKGVARAGAFGLQTVLRQIALWMKLNPEEVVVTPNLDFAEETVTGKDLLDLVGAKNQGFPISQQTLHEYAKRNEITTLTFEEEMALIEAEEPLVPPVTESGAPVPDNNQP